MPPKNLNENNLNELMFKYQNNPQLLEHILLAKAEEQKRLTAEEWRQKEEAILQLKYIEYGINQNNIEDVFSANQNNSMDEQQDMGTSFLFDKIVMDEPIEDETMQLYFMPTENVVCTTASSSPTTDAPIYVDTEILPEFKPSPKHNRSYSSPSLPKQSVGNTAIIKSKSGRSIAHRTLSYENVMNLEEYNTKIMHEIQISKQKKKEQKRMGSLSPPNTEPLDHEKVMEALRAKLKRTSLPYPTPIRRPSPERHSPSPPPAPNMFPTTGVLLLNLNNRRRKPSKK